MIRCYRSRETDIERERERQTERETDRHRERERGATLSLGEEVFVP
jgi:hypothetical protein